MEDDMKTHDPKKYSFQKIGGCNICDHKPIFSPDGESLLIIVKNFIRVYNAQTSDCVRILEPESITNEIVSINFPKNEEHNLYGCSDSGRVIIWSWEQGVVLREKQLKIPPKHVVKTFYWLGNNEALITAIAEKNSPIHIGVYSITTELCLIKYDTVVPYYGLLSIAVGWCNNDRFFVMCNGSDTLYVQNIVRKHIKTEYINYNKIRFISVTAHNSEPCIVTTDALGRALMLRGNFHQSRFKELAQTTLHWHSLPLLSAEFSKQGNYLLTGGMEKVLVKWIYDNVASQAKEKEFIPRLPGMVRHIASSNTHIAVSLTTNTVVIANAQLRVTSTILESGGLSPAGKSYGSTLLCHRPLGALITGSRTGQLQLYSMTANKVLYNIDITQLNNLPSLRTNLIPADTEISSVGLSGDGKWMVTSEYRNDGTNYPEERLKFWEYTTNKVTPFILNTSVNFSHGGCTVISLALDSKGDYCVSSGLDDKFRIWNKVTTTYNFESKVSWSCLTSCYYSSSFNKFLAQNSLNNFKNHRFSDDNNHSYLYDYKENDIIEKIMNLDMNNDKPIKSNSGGLGKVAISQDGSLIAAWFGCKLTLWDSQLCTLRTALSHPLLKPKGLDVCFGTDDAAHYLVCTSSYYLAVWSLLSLTIKWMVPLRVACLTSDPFNNRVAVITTKNELFVFTPHVPRHILKIRNLGPAPEGVMRHCTFGPSDDNDIRLYTMKNDQEIFCLEPREIKQGKLEIISSKNRPLTSFGALLAEQQLSEVKAPSRNIDEYLDSNALGKTAIAQFFSGASHMMPPVELLCTSFLEHISGKEEKFEEAKDEIEELVEEPSSEDAEIEVNNDVTKTESLLWTPHYEDVKFKRLEKIAKSPFLNNILTKSIFD